MKHCIVLLILLFALWGCGGTVGQSSTVGQTVGSPLLDNATAQRAVFDAEGKYALALIAANAYVNLPLCDKSQPPCATLSVVRVIQKVQPATRAALDAAELTVRTPGFGNDIYTSSATAATSALGAFEAITSTLK